MQCRSGEGRLDESTKRNSVKRNGRVVEQQLGLVVSSISS
jgi:hypothetical protein